MNEKLKTIADEIIGYSDGAYDIAWGEDYEALTQEEQAEVQNAVYEELGSCDSCGWNFTIDSMENHADGQAYCWRCYEDVLETEEEEEEDVEDAD